MGKVWIFGLFQIYTPPGGGEGVSQPKKVLQGYFQGPWTVHAKFG